MIIFFLIIINNLGKDSNKRAINTKFISLFFTTSAEYLRDSSQKGRKMT